MSGISRAQVSSFPAGIFQNLKKQLGMVAIALAASGFLASTQAGAQNAVPVLTWRYDNTHSGANTQETALTPSNVNANSFGKLFSLSVDSTIYAQPLYVPNLTMVDGKVHNVLFVATENDSLYAFDADSNGGANSKPIWKVTLLDAAHGANAGATAVNYQGTVIGKQGDIGPTIGITGTPVINAATNTMYVVSNTEEGGQFYSRLHAINLVNGAEQSSPTVAQSPVQITASVAGTGTGSSGGQLAFDPLVSSQRPALDYYNGYVYIGYAAHGDIGPWHGWLFAYNATTMQQSAVLCLSPNAGGGGIWSSGAGLPIDDDAAGGRMFIATGNNSDGVTTKYNSFGPNAQLGESILDISLANGGLTPTDAFTAYNAESELDAHDLDQGSGGVLMVPDAAQSNPPILITAGKEGEIFLLNRNNLGGNNIGSDSNSGPIQDITGEIGGMWATPAYWNGNVYFWPSKDFAKLFSLTGTTLSGEPVSQSSVYSDFPGPSFSISSNGTQDGIAWAIKSDQYVNYGDAVMYAFAANDLTNPIYETDTNSSRDGMGIATKFAIPVVTNGKVYAVAHYAVDVYGLLNAEQTTAAPVISPNGGTFTASQSVSLSSSTSGAQIYYTLDGSTPTTASTLYSSPFTISTDTTVSAIATAAGQLQSAVTTAIFNFSTQTPTPTFAPAGGTYNAAQQVVLSDTDANAQIFYTVDGSTPSASSTLYSGPVTVAISETVNAIAIDPSLSNSNVASAAYTILAGGTAINFGNGFSITNGLTLNGSTVASNDSRMQLTDGGLNEAGSVFWNTPINIQAFTTSWAFQLSEAQANGYTFTIQNAPSGATAVGGDSAGLGYQGIPKSVAVKFNFYNYENEGNDSTGFYTDGEAPLTPTIDISPSGIELNSDDLIGATLTYDGTTLTLTLNDPVVNKTFTTSQVINIPQVIGSNSGFVGFTGGSGGLSASQKIASWTYTTQAVPPAFSVAAGTYTSTQSVALTSATSDAVIYYTTNGTTPTAASTVYSGPISVGTSETIEALAISPTMGTSVVASAAYVIESPAFTMSASSPLTLLQGASATSTITVTPTNGFTGNVALTCAVTANTTGTTDNPTCTAAQPAAISGSTPVTAVVTIDTQAGTSAGSYTATVTGTAGTVIQTAQISLTVNAVTANTGFSLTGPAITIAAAGSSGTSTISVTPSGGFTGTVALACALTSSPSGAIDPPTCSVGQPTPISGTAAVTSTLTVNTTGTTMSALQRPFNHLLTLGGGGTLAAVVLLFGIPRRRRKWQEFIGLLVLALIAGTAAVGCGGSSTHMAATGTTAGTYVVTVTGTAGNTTAKTTVSVTVQ